MPEEKKISARIFFFEHKKFSEDILQAFTPTYITYGYSYDGVGNGEQVSYSDFTTATGKYTTLHYTFVGNHTDGEKVPQFAYYYYSGNSSQWENGFYKALRTDAVFTPQTAVVRTNRNNGIGQARANFLITNTGNHGVATGLLQPSAIFPISTKNKHHIFDLYGRIVRRGSTNLEGLTKGIYIIHGKKYLMQ